MSIWRWAHRIESVADPYRISLGEGNTPLVRSRAIGARLGWPNLYFKLESSNPTGSYKDRFAAAAISNMRATGKSRCLATSSGNTGAALAAYCAAAEIACEIAIVETAPADKLRQMLAYGAKLYRVRGFGLNPETTRAVMEFLQQRGQGDETSLLISAFRYSPEGMSGVQTIAYEVAEQLPSIDRVFCCAGGGGLTLAVARGFQRLVTEGELSQSPKIECVQPLGNATIAKPLRDGADHAETVSCTSKISGLQVPNVIDGDETLLACRASGGSGHLVEDEMVWEVQSRLAREEGIFCEPAAAVPLAGALQAFRTGRIGRDETVVCLVTGSGFKDAASAERMVAGCDCPMLELSDLK